MTKNISNELTPRCHMPWQQMVIDSTGAVAPCCYWGAYDNHNAPIGDMKLNTIDEIWNGPGYQKLRTGMANGDLVSAGCAKCHALRQGMKLGFERDPDSEDDFETPYAANMRTLREEIATGAAVIEAKPTIVSYTPSHRCNIRCTHCYQESTRTVEVDRADADEEIRRLAPYLVRLVAGGGEPFLLATWKKFLAEFDINQNPYMTFSTSTNATILSDKVVDQLARFKDLVINVSMDGVHDVYERVRVGAKFDQVVANVDRLKELCRQAPSGKAHIGVSMCVMKSNIHDLPNFMRFIGERGMMYGISPVITMPPNENLTCFNQHPRDEMAGWSDAIDLAQAEFARGVAPAAHPDIPVHLDLLRAAIPFERAAIDHHRVKVRIPEGPLEQFQQTYGPNLVAYIFSESAKNGLSDHWAPIMDGMCEVSLPLGRYYVNIATKWAPAGFWDQIMFDVLPNVNTFDKKQDAKFIQVGAPLAYVA